jgi:pimeloyl-ACP methyl ester carboxylesterase
MTAIYLHGFASGVTSSKATYLGRRLRAKGVDVKTPDLNLPDFSTLTITRMLTDVGQLMDAATGPVTLIGSSLGAFVAVNAAVQRPDRVEKIVLMAPALDFGPPRQGHGAGAWTPETIAEWKARGSMQVFHYGYGRILPIHYALYEDARGYDAFNANVRQPVLVFQGRLDDVVDPVVVEEWCLARPNAELHLLDDGHQLTDSLEYIWEKIETFLELPNR